jgi:hypothetical protein
MDNESYYKNLHDIVVLYTVSFLWLIAVGLDN